MYYNKMKNDRKGKCSRVVDLYCCSLDYHMILLKKQNTTFNEFKLDVFGLLNNLKKYSFQNKKNLDRHLYNYIIDSNLDFNLDKDSLLHEIEKFKKTIIEFKKEGYRVSSIKDQ